MEVIRQFRRLLLAQVMLGIIAFCYAGQSAGLMVVAGGLVLLSWYIVEGPTGRPLPQWVIVAGAGIAVGWLLLEPTHSRNSFVLAIGYFTIALQILLLFGRKSNREYGEILILSLVQMVGASVLDVSIVYGLALTAYCALAIFTLLVFQLKVTNDMVTEQVRQVMSPTEAVMPARGVVGRGHRWQFRTTAAGLGLGCALIGAAVFVLAPRTDEQHGRSSAGASSFRARKAGFTATVDLTKAPDDSSDTAPVLHISLTYRGQRIDGERSFHLRGAALDYYDHGTWSRSQPSIAEDVPVGGLLAGRTLQAVPEGRPVVEGHVVLRAPVENALFSLYPVVWIKSSQFDSVIYGPLDQRLATQGNPSGPIEYDFHSVVSPAGLRSVGGLPDDNDNNPVLQRGATYLRTWHVDRERIREKALSVLREAGLTRDPNDVTDPNDHKIARALTEYLRKNYSYSLTRPAASPDVDPIADFLFVNKRGHCELFAAALAAMSRSIGMTSRVVSGFLVSEYNDVGGYYVARASNAHAWTEIYCGHDGWQEFDATPAGDTTYHPPTPGHLLALRELYDHLEFTWLNAVVAYDQHTRAAVLDQANSLGSVLYGWTYGYLHRAADVARSVARSSGLEKLHMGVLVVAAVVALLAGGSMVQLLLTRRRLRDALQLDRLPRGMRPSMARNLSFYLDAVQLLERHGFTRPAWQTPMGFAQSVAHQDADDLGPLTPLTEIFYEIRFGGHEPDATMRQAIQQQFQRLQEGVRRHAQRHA